MQKILDRHFSRLSPIVRYCAIGVGVGLCVVLVAVLVNILRPPADLGEFPALKPVVATGQRLVIDTPDHLERTFHRVGFDLDAIRTGQAKVPDLLVKEFPRGFATMKRTDRKKALFIQTLLPLVLNVNRTIVAQRETLRDIVRRMEQGSAPSRREQAWIARLAILYRTEPEKIKTLLLRIAPVPPSLALAQAATETGWGTSRFAREANALFGQWTFEEGKGIRPKDANPGTRHAIKRYDRLLGSAWDYARNLNTHRAYVRLRRLRATGVSKGSVLAATLEKYSERGAAYVTLLRDVIAQNRLAPFDQARLRD